MPGDGLGPLVLAVPALLVVCGVLVVGEGIWSIVRARRFLRVAHQAEGVVRDHRYRVQRRSGSRPDRVTTIPVLRFTTRAGQVVDAEQSVTLRTQVPDPGTEVRVLYDPADPGRAAMAGSTNGITPESAYKIVFGGVFTLIASNLHVPWLFSLL
jgi:hypothetical protein